MEFLISTSNQRDALNLEQKLKNLNMGSLRYQGVSGSRMPMVSQESHARSIESLLTASTTSEDQRIANFSASQRDLAVLNCGIWMRNTS